MPLARAWWRGSAWALAATLVVPGVLAIAIATVALGGGLRSLGAVAQIVNGPDVPETQIGGRDTTTSASTAHARHLPAVPRTATSRPTAISAFRAPATTAPATTHHGTATTPGGGGAATPARPVTRPQPSSGSTPAGSQQPAQGSTTVPGGTPQPTPQPDPVRQVG